MDLSDPTQRGHLLKTARFKVLLVAVWVVGFSAAVAGLDVRATYGARVSADEPQYLLTAISLGEDRNLNIDDEIDAEAYLPNSEIGLNQQTKNITPDKQVSPHDPLLPLLLAPPVAIAGWVGAKVFLALVAGLVAALTFWVAVRRFDVRETSAALVCCIFGASAPLAVYGNQIYPEIVAAGCVIGSVAAITARRRPVTVVWILVLISSLPWLSIKYVPVAAALGAWAAFGSERRGGGASRAWLIGGFLASGLLFVWAHRAWYGGLTPYAVGDHFVGGEFTVVGSSPNVFGRSRRLLGLMVDDKFGLAAWQPAWLFLFPAIGTVFRQRSGSFIWPLVALGVAWLNATFVALTMHGWWWPGRQVVVALPIAVLLICHWVAAGRLRPQLFAMVGAAGVFMLGALIVEGLRRNITWIVDFYEIRSPVYRIWQAVLPDYMNVTGATWTFHSLWLLVVLGLVTLGWREGARVEGVRRAETKGETIMAAH